MHLSQELYPIEAVLVQRFPHLRRAQHHGLALWVYGTILAGSACQNAVLSVLKLYGRWHTLRQAVREWLYDGKDRAAPCRTQVEVAACFGPLVRWVLEWWGAATLAVAVDVTTLRDEVTALVISVLYKGTAIPIAWCMVPGNQPGAWLEPILTLLQAVRAAIPARVRVLVLTDRGLWSPRLYKRIRRLGMHPLMRVQNHIHFQPTGQPRGLAQALVTGPGQAWVGRGMAFKHRAQRLKATLLVVWDHGHQAPWVLLTDLRPRKVGVCWYALRVWVELGFRALKGVGWQWQRTRRTDPARVARHWLVLAVATLWVLACGTRVEEAEVQGQAPDQLHRAQPVPPGYRRIVSVFMQGLRALQRQLYRGQVWPHLWLSPEAWPEPPGTMQITYYVPP